MRNKQIPCNRSGVLLLLVLFWGAGNLWAGGIKEAETAFSVQDASGRTVPFAALPERIVLAGRGVIPIADAAYMFPEAPERILSMVRCDQGQGTFIAVLDEGFLGNSIFDDVMGPEDVAALQPDCVLLKPYMAESLGNALERLGIPVIYVDLESPEQFARDVRILGTLFGNSERAEEVLAWYEKEESGVTAGLAKRDTTKDLRVLFVYHSQKGGSISFNVPPASWLQTRLIEEAGGVPVWPPDVKGKGWMKVGLEQIARWDPDVIFLTDYFTSVDAVKKELLADSGWRELRAAREGRLYAFPSDFYSWDQPDARWILALKWMAAVLHPDSAPVFNAESDIQDFFGTIYGMDRDLIDREIMVRLRGDFHP